MTQQDKDLLLRDLSARLPYKPKIKILSLWNENKEVEEDIVDSIYCVMSDGYINTETVDSDISLDDIVLYLRPMSSMTEEERAEFYKIGGLMSHKVETDTYVLTAFSPEAYDWLNAHHFDYRGLIGKGLALEAPEGMYNLEKK